MQEPDGNYDYDGDMPYNGATIRQRVRRSPRYWEMVGDTAFKCLSIIVCNDKITQT